MNSKQIKRIKKSFKAQGLLGTSFVKDAIKQFKASNWIQRTELAKMYQGKDNNYEKIKTI